MLTRGPPGNSLQVTSVCSSLPSDFAVSNSCSKTLPVQIAMWLLSPNRDPVDTGLVQTLLTVQSLSRVPLCDPMDRSMPGSFVLHCLPGVCSNLCPLSRSFYPASSSSAALLLLPSVFPSIRVFSSVSSSHQVAKVLELQLQSFQ